MHVSKGQVSTEEKILRKQSVLLFQHKKFPHFEQYQD